MGSAHDLSASLTPYLLRCTFDPPATRVRCGVSGGADSLALLVLAVEAGLSVTAVHVDHGLRDQSDSESLLVHAAADSLGCNFESIAVSVSSGPNLEERARDARHSALGPGSLTGHTADDQAETVLLQLMRGAGTRGLAAMEPGPTKPLLALRRSDTEAVCELAGLTWFNDPTNEDPRFRRNRVRADLLPRMSEIAERDVVPLLARTADQARHAEWALDQLLPRGDPADTRWLQTLEPNISALVVRRWLATEIGRPISADATLRVMQVVSHQRKATEVEGGWRVERSNGRLIVAANQA